jgi:hypothetical protein
MGIIVRQTTSHYFIHLLSILTRPVKVFVSIAVDECWRGWTFPIDTFLDYPAPVRSPRSSWTSEYTGRCAFNFCIFPNLPPKPPTRSCQKLLAKSPKSSRKCLKSLRCQSSQTPAMPPFDSRCGLWYISVTTIDLKLPYFRFQCTLANLYMYVIRHTHILSHYSIYIFNNESSKWCVR